MKLLKGSSEIGDLHLFVHPWSEGIFDVGVATRVFQFNGEGEVLTFRIDFNLLQKGLNFIMLLFIVV